MVAGILIFSLGNFQNSDLGSNIEYPEGENQITEKGNTNSVEQNNQSNIQTAEHLIEIKNFAYNPVELKIKKGDIIIWVNKDSAWHTVTSDNGNELKSKLLNKEESYIHSFMEAGTFDYHCTPHAYMKGKIIVE
ncbi:hypothetical protein COU59_03695 [Candidatus Pacearchaeota archaeon CG10_big_fil_rev_8_21_14_0_10_34_12]|nr:MAG: hypothetical protein COU59_03695 [Candidatus Pacearchaeota archaeon CG10_big_fil_rev_8_21_14_0_10_34_12]